MVSNDFNRIKKEIAVLENLLRKEYDWSQEDINTLEVWGSMENDEGGISGKTKSVDFFSLYTYN